jgi:cobyrinic acid a,c-diamide synthase
MKIPRIIIASPSSNVGKTTITLGIIYGIAKQGYKVQSYKVGPDYIDPSYHKILTYKDSINLDTWLMGNNEVIRTFIEHSSSADISVIEGVMGLFDGINGNNDLGSSAHIARLLKSPIILVLDASKMSRSIAAIAYGFIKFDPRLEIKGVIINNVASEKHAKLCLDALKCIRCDILGVIERNNNLKLEERHLGLIPTYEDTNLEKKVKDIAEYIANRLRIRKIIEIAINAQELGYNVKIRSKNKSNSNIRIGVALDRSFNFYYPNNLERLRENGVEIVLFSPLNDKLPDVNGLYIGGGFPEILANELVKNNSILFSIKKLAYDNMPIYAECGGLMYLSRYIIDRENRKYKMVGLFDTEAVMTKNLTLNYTLANTINDSLIIKNGNNIKGHEFHYSIISNITNDRFAYELKRGKGIDGKHDGIILNNTLASYMHVYFTDKMAKRFVQISNNYK